MLLIVVDFSNAVPRETEPLLVPSKNVNKITFIVEEN
jgi:hypothetical protein